MRKVGRTVLEARGMRISRASRACPAEVSSRRPGKNWSGREGRRAFQAKGARARTKGIRNPAQGMFGKWKFGSWAISGHIPRPMAWPLIGRL